MAKHKYIATPEKMWELFCEYRKQVKNNPIKLVEQSKVPQRLSPAMLDKMSPKMIGKFMKQVIDMPLQRPLTIEGFENYCADMGVIEDMGHYFENRDGRYSEYIAICTRIKKEVRQDQIEGGMAGIYNASITQRLNGLRENIDMSVKEQPLFPDVPKNDSDK